MFVKESKIWLGNHSCKLDLVSSSKNMVFSERRKRPTLLHKCIEKFGEAKFIIALMSIMVKISFEQKIKAPWFSPFSLLDLSANVC